MRFALARVALILFVCGIHRFADLGNLTAHNEHRFPPFFVVNVSVDVTLGVDLGRAGGIETESGFAAHLGSFVVDIHADRFALVLPERFAHFNFAVIFRLSGVGFFVILPGGKPVHIGGVGIFKRAFLAVGEHTAH